MDFTARRSDLFASRAQQVYQGEIEGIGTQVEKNLAKLEGITSTTRDLYEGGDSYQQRKAQLGQFKEALRGLYE